MPGNCLCIRDTTMKKTQFCSQVYILTPTITVFWKTSNLHYVVYFTSLVLNYVSNIPIFPPTSTSKCKFMTSPSHSSHSQSWHHSPCSHLHWKSRNSSWSLSLSQHCQWSVFQSQWLLLIMNCSLSSSFISFSSYLDHCHVLQRRALASRHSALQP